MNQTQAISAVNEIQSLINNNEIDRVDEVSRVEVAVDKGNKENKEERVENLKVKADPIDVSDDERKRNVKNLAGAVSHSLRSNGEIKLRCFGNASISKAAKALAIARDYIAVQDLVLFFAPSFINADIGGTELTGIKFSTFANKKSESFKDPDIDVVKNILKVQADPKDILPEERRLAVKKLAGAIAHSLEENGECVVRCFGNATIGKAVKALAIARGFTATRGPDLYCWNKFIIADMNGNERTGIAFYVYTNSN